MIVLLMTLAIAASAQPYPPQDPEGNPVPVEDLLWVFAPVAAYFTSKLWKHKK